VSRYYFRLNLYHRILHGMVITSFLGLALTGLPLKYSATGWGRTLSTALGGPFVAGYLHRVFAVVTFLYFALHLGYVARLVLRRDGGVFWGPMSMVPQPRDAVQLYQHVRYFLGLGQRPRFDRWTYWEKFDYWAVFWGMAIIGSSGAMLAFKETVAAYAPGWVFNVATLVHGEEAFLAAVFLFTRTTFGRAIYAIGNRERAAYLSGIGTQRVVMIAFAISGIWLGFTAKR
jgi:cytochrome b subunit of formate dehydrogenase